MNKFDTFLGLSLKLKISPFRIYAIHGKILNVKTLNIEQRNKLGLVMAYLKESYR